MRGGGETGVHTCEGNDSVCKWLGAWCDIALVCVYGVTALVCVWTVSQTLAEFVLSGYWPLFHIYNSESCCVTFFFLFALLSALLQQIKPHILAIEHVLVTCPCQIK